MVGWDYTLAYFISLRTVDYGGEEAVPGYGVRAFKLLYLLSEERGEKRE